MGERKRKRMGSREGDRTRRTRRWNGRRAREKKKKKKGRKKKKRERGKKRRGREKKKQKLERRGKGGGLTEKMTVEAAPANSIGAYLSLPWMSRSVRRGARLKSGETMEMSASTSLRSRSEKTAELWLTPPSKNDSTYTGHHPVTHHN